MPEFTLLGFASFLSRVALEIPLREHEALEKASMVIETEAKRVIGTYDYGWPRLAPSTLEHKAADTPLLETGALRASIEHNVGDRDARIGTNSMIGVYQEMGTSRGIPPRPFMAGAAIHKEKEVVEILGEGALIGLLRP